jgi:SAM-dependent methyltransferase
MRSQLKKTLKNIPVLGPMGNNAARFVKRTSRKLRGKTSRGWDQYTFTREILPTQEDTSVHQVVNLLNYLKTSTVGQGAGPLNMPASVSMTIKGQRIQGTREAEERLDFFPQSFEGKTVLDIGSSHGGMLFAIADKIEHGVGIDFDILAVNTANKIRSVTHRQNLDFFAFDLEKENLELIRDLIPTDQVDVTFLLAVCAWIKNSDDVIHFISQISKTLFFETNGDEEVQQSQIDSLRKNFQNVDFLMQVTNTKNGQEYVQRRLFFCH